MKTIISGPPEPKKPWYRSRRNIGVLAASAVAVCTISVMAVVLPARAEIAGQDPVEPRITLPDEAPQDMTMDPGGYAGVANTDPEINTADTGNIDFRVERSGQLLYEDPTAAPAGITTDGQNEISDGDDTTPPPTENPSENENDVDHDIDPVSGATPDHILDESGKPGSETEAELEAMRQDLENMKLELEAERRARKDAEAVAEKAQSKPVETNPEPEPEAEIEDPVDNTGAPEWLGLDPEMPSWLTTTLEKAVWNNPYDGGPLFQISYAQAPCPLENADTRMYVELGAPVSTLTQGDLLAFVNRSVKGCTADWCTIVGSDGYGLQFANGPDFAFYGLLDEYGQVVEASYVIMLTENGYEPIEANG